MEKELEDYTIEELREEIKRRNKLAEENKRSRNCIEVIKEIEL